MSRWSLVVPLTAVLGGCTEVNLTAIENKPPTATILSHRDGDTVLEGYMVTFLGSVTDDREEDKLVATWFAGDSEMCSGTPPETGDTFCTIQIPGGEPTMRLRLEGRDAENERAAAIIDLNVQPTLPPEVSITRPVAGGSYYSNTPVPLEGVATDAEDDSSELAIAWTADGGHLADADTVPGSNGSFSSAHLFAEGDYTLVVTATDLGGKSATDSVTIHVGPPNNVPTCAFTAPTDGGTVGQWAMVDMQGIAEDADVAADVLSVTFSSSIDGTLGIAVPTPNGDVTFQTDQLSLGDHVLTLTVTDDAGATCSDTITFHVVDPPSAPGVHIDPQAPQSADDLVCIIDVASIDPQGDPISYVFSWTVDGVDFAGAVTTNLLGDTVPHANTAPNQVWVCSAVGTDGASFSGPGTDQVQIALPTVVSTHVGHDHSCQIDTNDELQCWGQSNLGQTILSGGTYVDAGLGSNHTCAINDSANVVCSGLDLDGQASPPIMTRAQVQIDAGDAHTCSLDDLGDITCWGSDIDGQSDTSGLTGTYTQVSSNFRHNCAVRDNAAVDCWGNGTFGRTSPTPGVLWSQISAGKYHTCGLDLTGLAFCFGRNNFGETISPGGTWDMIGAGEDYTCGLRGTGAIECWGADTGAGQLHEPPIGSFTWLDVGNHHACAVDAAGAVVCWGQDGFGETNPPLTWW